MTTALADWLLSYGSLEKGILVPFNDFTPRDYQVEPIQWIRKDGIKRIVEVIHRRGGKDFFWLNFIARLMHEEPISCHYIFPTYSGAKRVIWNGMTHCKRKYLDVFPSNLILHKNSQEMILKIATKCGRESLIQLIGSDKQPSNLKGVNVNWVVFSEAAFQDLSVWHEVYSPILAANGGTAVFISTPNGMNEFYHLYQMAKTNPEWRARLLTVEDTKVIPLEEIERMRRENIPEDMIQQEMYCNFRTAQKAVFYESYLEDARREKRIDSYPYHPEHPVHTVWDIGPHTAIVFYQRIQNQIYIIDCYYSDKTDLFACIKEVQNKPYLYGNHFAPHDIAHDEYIAGSRLDFAKRHGITFCILDRRLSVEDGIHRAMTLFPLMHFHEETTRELIHALKHYRREYDHKYRVYKRTPRHDWSSHLADALRYLAISYASETTASHRYDPKKSKWRHASVLY